MGKEGDIIKIEGRKRGGKDRRKEYRVNTRRRLLESGGKRDGSNNSTRCGVWVNSSVESPGSESFVLLGVICHLI